MSSVSVLAKVERNGALVDANMLLAQSEELETGLERSVIRFGLLLVRNST